ncbi:MAG: hypothetical protein A2142_03685 [candidate division Zixibacteria bacterium RBG_16_48_11]|nr:MAG: hypothetical protein A2142_03685 [candidate division Zixibacteria bacterium RBG_16_48_11]
MRRNLMLVTLLGLALLLSSAVWAKKEKTGVLDKDVFTDSLKKYQLTVPYNWRAKPEKEPSLLRATLQKIKLEPPRAGSSQGYDLGERFIPTIKILADTTSLSLERFCELLLAGKDGLARENEYLMKLDLLIQSELKSEQKIKLGEQEGVKYTFQKKYLKQVRDPREKIGGTIQNVTVEESLLGYLILTKKNNQVFMIQCLGERDTFEFEDQDYQKLLASWKFIS